ncbi:hypothetical protein BDQ12DRAFT_404409 [Crucibulum laeve]|uniref:Uncharacterized protein n=1 Tax=Crucibulum laeve TaxID=68775 RepID=A0A5C3LKT3_9AGAR|nr:hypothetical protein BDQ12DRAFT_404409 [Crucibulum laeve]
MPAQNHQLQSHLPLALHAPQACLPNPNPQQVSSHTSMSPSQVQVVQHVHQKAGWNRQSLPEQQGALGQNRASRDGTVPLAFRTTVPTCDQTSKFSTPQNSPPLQQQFVTPLHRISPTVPQCASPPQSISQNSESRQPPNTLSVSQQPHASSRPSAPQKYQHFLPQATPQRPAVDSAIQQPHTPLLNHTKLPPYCPLVASTMPLPPTHKRQQRNTQQQRQCQRGPSVPQPLERPSRLIPPNSSHLPLVAQGTNIDSRSSEPSCQSNRVMNLAYMPHFPLSAVTTTNDDTIQSPKQTRQMLAVSNALDLSGQALQQAWSTMVNSTHGVFRSVHEEYSTEINGLRQKDAKMMQLMRNMESE